MIEIKTYQDLLELGENERERMNFVLNAINEHKATEAYRVASDAEEYYRHRNPTIMKYQKFVYNQMGKAVPDIWTANNKIASNWYFYFTTQGVQYLLGNGISFAEESTKERLGKDFDKAITKAATYAKNGGVSFGFWNYDRLDVFSVLEFAPLYDEENGSLMAGVRFWQVDADKPLRATLYEVDGYTDYIKRYGEDIAVLNPKRHYKQVIKASEIDGETIFDGDNYPTFPIVPLWNINKQSDLVGNQGTLDAYDLVQSGLVNNVSDGEFIYWILKNCGGMSPEDDAKFIEQLKLTHVAHAEGDDGADVEAHKTDIPFDASEVALARLEKQLFADFMALNVSEIRTGNVVNAQIEAAYEPINEKTDLFEHNVTEFIEGILELAEIEDTPTYTRSKMANNNEIVETVLSSASYLDGEYITKKILTLLGDADAIDGVLERMESEESERYVNVNDNAREEIVENGKDLPRIEA